MWVALGGHLATFASKEEWDEMVRQVGQSNIQDRWSIWIGASDIEKEGTWRWVTGEPLAGKDGRMGNPTVRTEMAGIKMV